MAGRYDVSAKMANVHQTEQQSTVDLCCRNEQKTYLIYSWYTYLIPCWVYLPDPQLEYLPVLQLTEKQGATAKEKGRREKLQDGGGGSC
ncbi:hypothetical protein T10_8834 [Trichinella papuae]|uniref:Uncharacterized protein n=1 Tax=Trichinella papuae TaxID=268474 RepID=A0A0V1MM20_9BILA|nr:hypothetical protein T10_4736 [Trichinella papuae]KRZ72891.1 hypothetical protein T10_8834 [Trichinella papuae]